MIQKLILFISLLTIAQSHTIFNFNSSTDWKTIEVNLSEMYPVFRRRKLKSINYNSESIEEIGLPNYFTTLLIPTK